MIGRIRVPDAECRYRLHILLTLGETAIVVRSGVNGAWSDEDVINNNILTAYMTFTRTSGTGVFSVFISENDFTVLKPDGTVDTRWEIHLGSREVNTGERVQVIAIPDPNPDRDPMGNHRSC